MVGVNRAAHRIAASALVAWLGACAPQAPTALPSPTVSRPSATQAASASPLASSTPEATRTPADASWQQLRRELPPDVPIIEPTWMPPAFSAVSSQMSAVTSSNLADTTYVVSYTAGRDRVLFALRSASVASPSPGVIVSGVGTLVRRSRAVLSFSSDLFYAPPGTASLRVVSWAEGAYGLRIESETISGDDLLHIAWSLDQTGAPGPGPATRVKPGACADATAPEATIRRLIALTGSHDLDALADCFAFQGGAYGVWADLPSATLDLLRLVQGSGGRRQLQAQWTFSSNPGGAWNLRQNLFFMVGREDGLWRIFDSNTAPFPTPP